MGLLLGLGLVRKIKNRRKKKCDGLGLKTKENKNEVKRDNKNNNHDANDDQKIISNNGNNISTLKMTIFLKTKYTYT